MKPLKKIIPLVIYLALTIPVAAEAILLRNGDLLNGRILDQNRNSVTIKTSTGVQNISKTRISRIIYSEKSVQQEIKKIEEKQIAELEKIQREQDQERQLALEKEKLEKKRIEEEKRQLALEKEAQKKLLDDQNNNQDAKISDDSSTDKTEEKSPDSDSLDITKKSSKALDSAWSAVWRSALLPGWGQWADGRPWTGALYATAFVGGSGATYSGYNQYMHANEDYAKMNNPDIQSALLGSIMGQSSGPTVAELSDPVFAYLNNLPYENQRQAVKSNYRSFQQIGLGMIAFYVWNIFDAYIFHGPDSRQEGSFNSNTQNRFIFTLESSPDVSSQNHLNNAQVFSNNQNFQMGMSWRF